MAGVYLVFRNRIFRDAVSAILETCPEIKLLGTTNRPDEAASAIAALTPDVILLEETQDGAAIDSVQHLLTSPTPGRLITLRLDQDGMHVWSQIWRQSVGPRDLVEAIIAVGEYKP
jgi:chemotaxis response regulator CheB